MNSSQKEQKASGAPSSPHLKISCNEIRLEEATALVNSPHLKNLKVPNLSRNNMEEEEICIALGFSSCLHFDIRRKHLNKLPTKTLLEEAHKRDSPLPSTSETNDLIEAVLSSPTPQGFH